jgi:uncharacterized protein (TIGR03084 family)
MSGMAPACQTGGRPAGGRLAAMDRVVAALEDQQVELTQLVAGLDEAGWQAPSRCEGWSVADVLLHLAQTNEMALASLEHRLPAFLDAAYAGLPPGSSVDEGAALLVDRERGAPPAEVLARWQGGAAALLAAFEAADLRERVTWVAGDLTARTLATTRLAETWIHTGDIAAGLGVELVPTDRLWHVARLAWRTLPYAFAQAGRALSGPVRFELRAPSGDTWVFSGDDEPLTTLSGDAAELCLVAGRRLVGAESRLRAEGPDADAVLDLVRTFA